MTGSHLEEPLKCPPRRGRWGKKQAESLAGRDHTSGPVRLCVQSQYSPLISHFFLFKYPLKAEKWLRKDERSAFLATGLESIWLTDGGAGADVPSGSGCCRGGFQGVFYHG